MKKTDVLVFHSHGVGQLIQTKELPRNGETVWSSSWEIGLDAAKGSNVAIALSRLGIKVAFAGRIGCDIWGNIALKMLKTDEIDISKLIMDDNYHTMIGIVLVDKSGSNSIILGGENASFSEHEIIKTLDYYSDTSYVVTGFEIDLKSALMISRIAHQKGKKVILNASPIPKDKIGKMPFVDILVVNESEAKALCTLSFESYKDIAKELKTEYSIKNIVITLGEKGSAILENEEFYTLEAWPQNNVVDTSGAGDSYLAAMTAFLTKGCSLKDSCALASIYASKTIETKGTIEAFATIEEMKEMFSAYDILK